MFVLGCITPRRHLQRSLDDCRVITRDISVSAFGKGVITPLHLFDRPTQRVGRLLRVCHRLSQQMRETLILTHFDLLRVNQNETHLVWCRPHEQRRNDAVDTARLTRPCCSCDQHVRGRRKVQKDCFACNVFSDRNFKWVCGLFRFL